MKAKASKATVNKAQAQEARDYGVKYFDTLEIIKNAIEPTGDKGATRYKLAEGVELGIFFTDKDTDFAYISVCGLSVNVTVRAGKMVCFSPCPPSRTRRASMSTLLVCTTRISTLA